MGSNATWARPALLAALLLAGTTLAQGGSPGEWTAPGYAARKPNAVAADSAAVAAGRTLFVSMCAACHGNAGKGDGPAATALEPKPRDLTKGDWYRQTDGALSWKIRTGRAPMPAFSAAMTEKQTWQVVHFLRSIQPREESVPTRLPDYRVPDAARRRTSATLARYFAWLDVLRSGRNLGLDDARARLQRAAGELTEPGAGIEGPARDQWQQRAKALSDVLSRPPDDTELDLQRITDGMAEVLGAFGHDEPTPVWLFRCPHARSGVGGEWLQLSPSPDNPFGAGRDRTCGTAQATFAGAAPPKAGKDQGGSP